MPGGTRSGSRGSSSEPLIPTAHPTHRIGREVEGESKGGEIRGRSMRGGGGGLWRMIRIVATRRQGRRITECTEYSIIFRVVSGNGPH